MSDDEGRLIIDEPDSPDNDRLVIASGMLALPFYGSSLQSSLINDILHYVRLLFVIDQADCAIKLRIEHE